MMASPTVEIVRYPLADAASARGGGFHYADCGCAVHCGGSVDWIWHANNLRAVEALGPRLLRVAFLIPHHNLTGGLKILVHHMQALRRRGHWIAAIYRGPPGCSSALPPWASDLIVDESILVALNEPMLSALQRITGGIHVAVVGYFTQLDEIRGARAPLPIPLIYLEQGHEHVFADAASADATWDKVFHASMNLPVPIISVSAVIRDILKVNFARVAPIVSNAIDCALFKPPPLLDLASTAGALPYFNALSARRERRVMIIGNPGLPLKNHSSALRALELVSQQLTTQALHVTWVCQAPPAISGTLSFKLVCVVNPEQGALPAIYASGFDALLFTSVYEAWAMPVLEAMAAGVPVVTSKCYGVDSFATEGVDCLMAEPHNTPALAAAVLRILQSPSLAAALAVAGRRAAERCNWDVTCRSMEVALRQVAFCLNPARLTDLAAVGVTPPTITTEPNTGAVVAAPAGDTPVCQRILPAHTCASLGLIPPGEAHAVPMVELIPAPSLLDAVSTTAGHGARVARE